MSVVRLGYYSLPIISCIIFDWFFRDPRSHHLRPLLSSNKEQVMYLSGPSRKMFIFFFAQIQIFFVKSSRFLDLQTANLGDVIWSQQAGFKWVAVFPRCKQTKESTSLNVSLLQCRNGGSQEWPEITLKWSVSVFNDLFLRSKELVIVLNEGQHREDCFPWNRVIVYVQLLGFYCLSYVVSQNLHLLHFPQQKAVFLAIDIFPLNSFLVLKTIPVYSLYIA